LVCLDSRWSIGRRLEDKTAPKVFGAAKNIITVDGFQISAPEIGVGAAAVASEVLSYYVIMGGHRLAYYFRNALRNRQSRSQEEPLEPSMVIELVAKAIQEFDIQLACMLSDPRRQRGVYQHRRKIAQKNSMEMEMECLYARKLQIYAPVPFSRASAVLAIARIVFKAFCEYVREETLTVFALQQVQIDSIALKDVMNDYIEADDANVMDCLASEVITSASRRCLEPALLEQDTLEMACERRKRG